MSRAKGESLLIAVLQIVLGLLTLTMGIVFGVALWQLWTRTVFPFVLVGAFMVVSVLAIAWNIGRVLTGDK